jgi:general secretion pathway protein A
VVLAGDPRLIDKLRHDELLPLGSRIRMRLTMEYAGSEDLNACLAHLLDSAGNPTLMSEALKTTLWDPAAGSYLGVTPLSSIYARCVDGGGKATVNLVAASEET